MQIYANFLLELSLFSTEDSRQRVASKEVAVSRVCADSTLLRPERPAGSAALGRKSSVRLVEIWIFVCYFCFYLGCADDVGEKTYSRRK